MAFNPQKSLHSKELAQNFLRNTVIARDLIRKAGISKGDTVIEIGPGEGALTRELVGVAGRVIAIESDPVLVTKLSKKFEAQKNVIIEAADFLAYQIKEEKYKVFANIPFNITNQIVKKLLFSPNPPSDAWLFVQKEAAFRLCGIPKDQELSIITKPWFTYGVVYEFCRDDFVPKPSVDVVLLHIHRLEQELLEFAQRKDWRKFVTYGYCQQKKDLEANFKKIFTHDQWKRLAKDIGFSSDAATADLKVEQWIGLFRYFQKGVSAEKKKAAGL
jgi:23S rRNA (adenine-N6)-dimethyltransferase